MVNQMSITTKSATETRKLGERLGALLHAGDVVFLSGDLGSGKTTFSKGVARGLGVHEDVTSPTFTLVAEYEGRVPVAHMDLYRLQPDGAGGGDGLGSSGESTAAVTGGATGVVAQRDRDAIGLEDYLMGQHVVLVEWPGDLVEAVDDALRVEIVSMPVPRVDEREFRCQAVGPRSWEILDEWVKEWLF